MIDPNMTIEDYHRHPAFGSTDLKLALRSPLHMANARSNPRAMTEAMRIGQAAHTFLLEPEQFKDRFYVCPTFQGEGSRKARSAFLSLHAGKMPLSDDEWGRVLSINNAVVTHREASDLLASTKREESYFTKAQSYDLHLKCRPDALTPDGYIVDLKTCQDASPEGFSKQISRFKYHLQAALYADVCQSEGVDVKGFRFIAVETEAPFAVGVYELTNQAIEKGRELYYGALAKIRLSIDDPDQWLGYRPNVQTIDLEKWAYYE